MRHYEKSRKCIEQSAEHSAQSGYVYDRLYRNLFNREFFLQAYQNIYASQGNMTAGTDGKTIDAMSLERVDRLIAALKDESYQPKPSRRTYIPKKNGKLRPLGIPSIDDKLVQELSVCCWNPSMKTALRTPPTAFDPIKAVTQP